MAKVNQNGTQTDTTVSVSLPDEVSVELVQANPLRHYELYGALAALLSSFATGFATAYFTTKPKEAALMWSALAFSTLTVLFVILTFIFRSKIFHGSVKKKIKLNEFK
ncbi:MAG: hypothetical protein HY395_02410 [Candidatus Doudnabacteria bacterium]|nr:hypothetical protein [Candidatus Doudnabacteria bacterium]